MKEAESSLHESPAATCYLVTTILTTKVDWNLSTFSTRSCRCMKN